MKRYFFVAAALILTSISTLVDASTLGLMATNGFIERRSTISPVAEFFSKMDLYYYVKFNGPGIGLPPDTHYNFFNDGQWPNYLSHSIDMIYYITPVDQVGVEVSGIQDLVSGVYNKFDTEIVPQFTIFHPQFWYRRNKVLNPTWMSLDLQLSIFPATSDFAIQKQGMLFSAAFDQVLNIKMPSGSPWSANISTRLQPSFYNFAVENETGFGGFYNRDTFFMHAEHFVGYQLGNGFQLTNSSHFDLAHKFNSLDAFDFSPSSVARTSLQLNYFFPRRLGNIGAFIQTPVFDPILMKTVVGLDFRFNFLAAN